jgi:hypothetical protein
MLDARSEIAIVVAEQNAHERQKPIQELGETPALVIVICPRDRPKLYGDSPKHEPYRQKNGPVKGPKVCLQR